MGRKRKHAAVVERPIFCFYCDRTFADETTLIVHQKGAANSLHANDCKSYSLLCSDGLDSGPRVYLYSICAAVSSSMCQIELCSHSTANHSHVLYETKSSLAVSALCLDLHWQTTSLTHINPAEPSDGDASSLQAPKPRPKNSQTSELNEGTCSIASYHREQLNVRHVCRQALQVH
jgi:hypothetical protein